MTLRFLLVAALAASTSGCGMLYTNVRVPRAYRSATPIDVKTDPSDRTARGEACNQSVLYLVAWGNGGYAEAVREATSGEDAVLYDVKADVKVTSVLLGIYTRTCTVVTGKVSKR